MSYIEFCHLERRAITRLFKEFPHRSGTYLWHFFKAVQGQLGNRAELTRPLKQLLEPSNLAAIESVNKLWAQARHELQNADRENVLAAVRILANVSNAMFAKVRFGYFSAVQKERFAQRYYGRFRVAHGKPPLSGFLAYSGAHSFSESEAFLYDHERGIAIPLTPLVFYYPCQLHRDEENGHCFVFDKFKSTADKYEITFKASGFPCQLQISPNSIELAELGAQFLPYREQDPQGIAWFEGLKVTAAYGH